MITSLRGWITARARPLILSGGLAVVSLALVLSTQFDQARASISLSAGPLGTRRNLIANDLATHAKHRGLDVEIVANAGSEECLNLLKAEQLDTAIISSGVIVPDDEAITVLAAIQLEAVHVLLRKDLVSDQPLTKSILGKRVRLGEIGSTERLLALEFLKFAGLKLPDGDQPGDVIPVDVPKTELIQIARAIESAAGSQRAAMIAELPDCLLVLSPLPSELVQSLMEAADYQLISLPATRAFLLDNLQEEDPTHTVVQREFLQYTTIPAGSYFADGTYPKTDCETVGVRLLVVARKDLPISTVQPLMETLFEGEFAHRTQPATPRELATPYAMHAAAAAYFDRDKPLLANALLGWLSDGLSVFGAFCAGALSLYSLCSRTRVKKPSEYFAEIRRIEQLAVHSRDEPTAFVQHLEMQQHLDEQLAQLRRDLIEDLCEGRLKGDQQIANVFLLLRDAQRNLANLEATRVSPLVDRRSARATPSDASPTISEARFTIDRQIARSA